MTTLPTDLAPAPAAPPPVPPATPPPIADQPGDTPARLVEHQVVVVFDVTTHDVLNAGRLVADLLHGAPGYTDGLMPDARVESWWMPEEPLRSQVDRNDNTAMHLTPTDPPPGIYVEDDAEDTPTVWLHRPDDPERPMALLQPGHLGRRGQELLWDHIVTGLPTSPPVTS